MNRLREVCAGVYMVGSSTLTAPEDCCVYLLDLGDLVMVDAGAGQDIFPLLENIDALGWGHRDLVAIVATHCHIDHIGGIPELRKRKGCMIIAHELDARSMESRDREKTAASWYNKALPPIRVDHKLSEVREVLKFKKGELLCLHTPGHTPGSISVILDRDGHRILFGQDIHGPLDDSFGSNIARWRNSMKILLKLEADILCEGHFGVFKPAEKVNGYIRSWLEKYGETNPAE